MYIYRHCLPVLFNITFPLLIKRLFYRIMRLAYTTQLKGGVVIMSLSIPGKSHSIVSAKDMVYLFELDSVRNNEMEIQVGQRRFYEAVTQEGKCVVLTFNQLTDSLAFLLPLKDTSEAVRNEYTKLIQALCNNGSIKISRFRQTRTAAQYVLDSLAKAINHEKISDSDFIFSSLPVKKGNRKLLRKIKEALMYSDLSIMENLVNLKNDEGTAFDTLDLYGITDDKITPKNLEYVMHYVEFILEISRQINAYIDPREDKFPGFTEYMDYALTAKPCHLLLLDPDLIPLYTKAQSLLNRIRNKELKGKSLMDRTKWSVALVERQPEEKIKLMAAAIIDLCYILTNQTSINGLQISYGSRNDFLCTFVPELTKLYQQYTELNHKICTPANWNPNIFAAISDWEYAVRITDAAKKTYIRDYSWKTVLLFSQLRKLGQGTLFVLLILLFDWLTDCAEDLFNFLMAIFVSLCNGSPSFYASVLQSAEENLSDFARPISEQIVPFLFTSILLTLVGSFFAFVLRKMNCTISDLLESLKHLNTTILDLQRVLATKKHKR